MGKQTDNKNVFPATRGTVPSIDDVTVKPERKIKNTTSGTSRVNGNIEIEKNEVVLTPEMQLFKALGEKHTNGGIPYFAKGGEFIYSDQIKMKGKDIKSFFTNSKFGNINPEIQAKMLANIKENGELDLSGLKLSDKKEYSIAEIASKFTTNNDLDILGKDIDQSNIYTKNAAKNNLENKVMALSTLSTLQEMFKAKEEQKKYAKGGLVKFGSGGSVYDYLTDLGLKADKKSRSQLASELGIDNYDFSAKKNKELLEKVKSKNVTVKSDSSKPSISEDDEMKSFKGDNRTLFQKAKDMFKSAPQELDADTYNKIINEAKPDKDGYVNLSKYNINTLSHKGIKLAEGITQKYPNAKIVCHAGGCAEIARKASQAEGFRFNMGDAWQFGNENEVAYQTDKMKNYKVGSGKPLEDPTSFNSDPTFAKLPKGYIIGLNRKNNKKSGEFDDSYDYAQDDKSRGYEHSGFSLGNGKILHGTGESSDEDKNYHPAYYQISNTDNINLNGYGRYEPMEAIKGKGKYNKGGMIKYFKGGHLYGPQYTAYTNENPGAFILPPDGNSQSFPIPQHKQALTYDSADYDIDEFAKRQAWYMKDNPDINIGDPKHVKKFQLAYNAEAIRRGLKPYFVGDAKDGNKNFRGVDGKFGRYTYNAPGFTDPNDVNIPPPPDISSGRPQYTPPNLTVPNHALTVDLPEENPAVAAKPGSDDRFSDMDYMSIFGALTTPVNKYEPIRQQTRYTNNRWNNVDLESQRQAVKGQINDAQYAASLYAGPQQQSASIASNLGGKGLEAINNIYGGEFNTNTQGQMQTDIGNNAGQDAVYNQNQGLTGNYHDQTTQLNQNTDEFKAYKKQQIMLAYQNAVRNKSTRQLMNELTPQFQIGRNFDTQFVADPNIFNQLISRSRSSATNAGEQPFPSFDKWKNDQAAMQMSPDEQSKEYYRQKSNYSKGTGDYDNDGLTSRRGR